MGVQIIEHCDGRKRERGGERREEDEGRRRGKGERRRVDNDQLARLCSKKWR